MISKTTGICQKKQDQQDDIEKIANGAVTVEQRELISEELKEAVNLFIKKQDLNSSAYGFTR